MYQKMIPGSKLPAQSKFGGFLSVSFKLGRQNVRPLSLGGFTLIELLVVVLIIGILAAIALPKYEIAVEKAHAAEALTVLRSVREAQEIYYMANGEYATDLETLDIQFPIDSQYWTYYHMGGSTFVWRKNVPSNKVYVLGFRTKQSVKGGKAFMICGWDNSAAKDFADKVCKALGATEKESNSRWILSR